MQKVLLKFKNPGESFRSGNVKKFVFRNFKKKKEIYKKIVY